jgi:hypothetical protein
MNYTVIFASFCFGFSLACLLIFRVSIKPSAKKPLKAIGIIKDHKARTPRKLPEVQDYSQTEI